MSFISKMKESIRIAREQKTIRLMIDIWCGKKHNRQKELCNECKDLLNYSLKRLDQCPFGENKSTCAKCHIHCYDPEYRKKIREVMRFSGPRMFYKHPILGIKHLIDEQKKV